MAELHVQKCLTCHAVDGSIDLVTKASAALPRAHVVPAAKRGGQLLRTRHACEMPTPGQFGT